MKTFTSYEVIEIDPKTGTKTVVTCCIVQSGVTVAMTKAEAEQAAKRIQRNGGGKLYVARESSQTIYPAM